MRPYSWSDGKSGLVPVAGADGTTVYITKEAVARREAAIEKSSMAPRQDLLSRAEEREFSENIGTPVTTWSEAKKAMWDRDMRFVEKGESRDKQERERKEWLADGKVGAQPTPNSRILPRVKPPDIRKLLREQGHDY